MALARGQKFLFGCLAVFGVLVLILILAGTFFVSWIRTPGPPLEGARIVDDGTAVYAEVRLRKEDPGAREYVRAFMTASRHPVIPADANLPGPVGMILGNIPQRDASDREVDRALPLVIAARREASPEGGTPALYAVSFAGAGNTMRLAHTLFAWVLTRSSKVHKETQGDDDLFRMEAKTNSGDVELWLSFIDTDVLFSRDEQAVRQGIDAMRRPSPSAAAIMADRSDDASLFIAAKPGYAGAAADAIDLAAPGIAGFLRDIAKSGAGVTLTGTLRSADLLEGELRLREADGGTGKEIPDFSGKMTLTMGSAPLDLAFESIPPPPGVKKAWKIRITGLQEAMRHKIDLEKLKGKN
jgi:hypothetical protein